MAIGEGLRVDLGRAPLLKPGGLDLNAMRQTPYGPLLLAGVKSAIDSFNDSVNNSQQWSNLLNGVNPVVSDAMKSRAQQEIDTAPLATQAQNAQNLSTSQVVPANTDLTLGQIANTKQNLPLANAKSIADINAGTLGANAQALQAKNLLSTTPNYSNDFKAVDYQNNDQVNSEWQKAKAANPGLPDRAEDDLLGKYSDLNSLTQSNVTTPKLKAIDQAKTQAEIARASFPFQGEGGGMGTGVQYYPVMENGKVSYKPESTQLIPQQMEDGTFHNVLVGKQTGKVYKDYGKSIQDQRIQNSMELAGAKAGFAGNSQNPTVQAIAKNANIDQDLTPKAQMDARKTAQPFNTLYRTQYAPKFQLFDAFDSVANIAKDPNSAGVADVDLIDVAGRLYKGGQMTEAQYKALKQATGIPDQIFNFPAKFMSGKQLTPEQRDAMISSVDHFKQELVGAYQRDYDAYTQKLPQGANPEKYLGPRDYWKTESKPVESQGQVPTVNTKEEWAALPSGTKYIGPDGLPATKK